MIFPSVLLAKSEEVKKDEKGNNIMAKKIICSPVGHFTMVNEDEYYFFDFQKISVMQGRTLGVSF